MPPDPELVETIATELGVDASFVEKDWYAMRLVSAVVGVRHDGVVPVFSGGTSLSKWRVLDPKHCRDRTLVRHLHDLAILERYALEHQGFPELLTDLMETDARRGTGAPDVAAHEATERLALALDVLRTDAEHEANYEGFVRAMCYGTENETPTFPQALDTVRRLGHHLG